MNLQGSVQCEPVTQGQIRGLLSCEGLKAVRFRQKAEWLEPGLGGAGVLSGGSFSLGRKFWRWMVVVTTSEQCECT